MLKVTIGFMLLIVQYCTNYLEVLPHRRRRRRIYFPHKNQTNTKMNKHVNKVRKATGRAKAITAGRQQNKQQYLIIQLMKKKER